MFDKKQSPPCNAARLNARISVALALACWVTFISSMMWSPLMAHAKEQEPQRTASKVSLGIELNSLTPSSSNSCRLNFVLHNGMPSAIDDLAFEIVLFDESAHVKDLLRLSGGALAKGKTRVRQFDLKDTKCSMLSRVLVNEITTCKGEGLTPRSCLQALNATSRTHVAFGL